MLIYPTHDKMEVIKSGYVENSKRQLGIKLSNQKRNFLINIFIWLYKVAIDLKNKNYVV